MSKEEGCKSKKVKGTTKHDNGDSTTPLFSWKHGDPALIYIWMTLGCYIPIVALYYNMAKAASIDMKTYERGMNVILFAPLLVLTMWRLGRAYEFHVFFGGVSIFSTVLGIQYYALKKQSMYFESILITFFLYLIAIPVWKYGNMLIPKRPGSRAKRLPPMIKNGINQN